MPCSRTQHGDACGVRTQDLSIRSPTLYHYATALPIYDRVSINIIQGIKTDLYEVVTEGGPTSNNSSLISFTVIIFQNSLHQNYGVYSILPDLITLYNMAHLLALNVLLLPGDLTIIFID